MAKQDKVTIEGLGEAISKELTIYSEQVTEAVDAAAAKAVKELVEKTKATAPAGKRKAKNFKRSIASKQVRKTTTESVYAWYVKPPNHRLTHLLVHGHATKDGGRTKADPFLQNALDAVLPQYEKDVEEAIKNGK